MRGATLSILGLYQYDPNILAGMQLPTGMTHDILDPDLLSECAELEILYPDPDVFKTILAAWSAHRVISWQRMYDASLLDYNAIENYDRKEDLDMKDYSAGYNPNVLGEDPAMVQQAETVHDNRIHGNIGVTTSQQMLAQELAISNEVDIYRFIIADFKARFCIPLY